MKTKLFLAAVAVVFSVSVISCGNKKAAEAEAPVEETQVCDSLKKNCCEASDSVACDSLKKACCKEEKQSCCKEEKKACDKK